MNIYERDRIRNLLMLEIYTQTDGDIESPVNFYNLINELSIVQSETDKALNYLLGEGLISNCGIGYSVYLTHYGIKQVESRIRNIDFNQNTGFNSTELFQLQTMLNEIKEDLNILKAGQEVVFNQIDETLEYSKTVTKTDWRVYFEAQIQDWLTQKIITESGEFVIKAVLLGLKLNI